MSSSWKSRGAWLGWLASPLVLAVPSAAVAFHPLATDDVGTQGGGGVELELSTLAAQPELDADPHRVDLALATHVGLAEALDVGVTLTLSSLVGDGSFEKGMADPVLDLKWRWLEGQGARPGLALRLDYKPAHDRAFSTRGHDAGALLVASWEGSRLAAHVNAGVLVRSLESPGSRELAGLGAATVTALLLPGLTAALELVGEVTRDTLAAPTALAGLVWQASEAAAVSVGMARPVSADEHHGWTALLGVTAALGG